MQQTEQNTNNTQYLTLNFIKEHECSTKKMVKLIEETLGKDDVEVRVAYRTQSFFSNKDKVSKELQSNVIYSYDCDLCPGHKYIGETV